MSAATVGITFKVSPAAKRTPAADRARIEVEQRFGWPRLVRETLAAFDEARADRDQC